MNMPEVIDIYHGSPKVIEQPVFGAGKVHNDYGRGFYCTEHAELAKEWACSSDNDGYANRRTKQEQRPSSLGLCLARRRKTEGQISQNLNENLAEHEVVTETVIYTIDCVEPAHARQTESELSSVLAQSQPSLKIERITDRVRTLESGSRYKATKVERW